MPVNVPLDQLVRRLVSEAKETAMKDIVARLDEMAEGWLQVTEPDVPPSATASALRKCARWLAYCLSIGWRRDHLDALEALWWKHHDNTGRLV